MLDDARSHETNLQAVGAIADLALIYKKVQSLAGFSARVMELVEAVESSQGRQAPLPVTYTPGSPASSSTEWQVEFAGVTIMSPDGKLLLKDLNLKLGPSFNLLITGGPAGANGAGKTSMFRVLAGLWTAKSGSVTHSPGLHMFYVPQRPYLVNGSLRDQIIYPALGAPPTCDAQVLQCLEMAGLGPLARGGLDQTYRDWSDILSGGEKQRVGLARVYFHQPEIAILDECTSAINLGDEEKLYAQFAKLGTTIFSIAHRPSVRPFHNHELLLVDDCQGTWELRAINNDGEGQ
eukprot:gene7714-1382_t